MIVTYRKDVELKANYHIVLHSVADGACVMLHIFKTFRKPPKLIKVTLFHGSSEKILLKPLKITIFWPNLCKTGVLMGHTQNKKQFFRSEIIKPDPIKLSQPFYFNKIPYILAEL